jgi:hypothetical protein
MTFTQRGKGKTLNALGPYRLLFWSVQQGPYAGTKNGDQYAD